MTINSNSTIELKKFGLTVGAGFLMLSGILFLVKRQTTPILILVGALLILSGLLCPLFLRPAYKAWMTLALIMGKITTAIILTVLFCILVIPISIISKIFGKKYLDLNFSLGSKDSFWKIRDQKKNAPESYEKQF